MSKLQYEKNFFWQGINSDGKNIQGENRAYNSKTLKEELHKIGIMPVLVKEKINFSEKFLTKKISKKNIRDFWQELTTLISAGLTITTALEIIKDGSTLKLMKILCLNIKNHIEQGNSLYSALNMHPRYFNAFTRNLINIGEKSGTLDTIMKHLNVYHEKAASEIRNLKKILFYPLCVIIFGIIITSLLFIFVVPQFQNIFLSLGAKLPFYTQCIISCALFLKNYFFLIIFILLFLIGTLFLSYFKIQKFKDIADKFFVLFPYFGHILKITIVSRIARSLSINVKAGINLYDAILLTETIIRNNQFKHALKSICHSIKHGNPLAYSFKKHSLFPERAIKLMSIGEESGTLENMLTKIADLYEEEVNYKTQTLLSLIEPFIMIFLGSILGGLIIGMYLPIFQLGKLM